MSRIVLFVVTGGIFLTWADPQGEFFRIALIIGVIFISAYLDAFLSRKGPGQDKVVSMGTYKSQKEQRANGKGLREKRMPRPVFSTFFYQEVDALLQILREEGLHPMMVSQSRGEESGQPVYRIMLPENEIPKGQPLIDRFVIKYQKKPS